MAKKIQQYRGLEKDLPRLEEARLAFTTDTKKLFIGSNTGNVEMTSINPIISSLVANDTSANNKLKLEQLFASSASEIIIPEGTYTTSRINSGFTNKTIKGFQGKTILQTNDDILIQMGTSENVIFQDITFVSLSTEESIYGVINILGYNVKNIKFINCTFKSRGSNGLKFVNESSAKSEFIAFEKCKFEDIGRMGVEFQNHNDDVELSRYSNISFKDCEFKNIGLGTDGDGMAISMSGLGEVITVSNCKFTDCGTAGVELIGAKYVNVDGNTFVGNGINSFSPISITNDRPNDYIIITNNKSFGNLDNIAIYTGKEVIFSNNIFHGVSDVYIKNTSYSKFVNNIIKSKGTYALMFDNSGYNEVIGNTLVTGGSNWSALRFYGENSVGNIINNNKLYIGDGGTYISEINGATDNDFGDNYYDNWKIERDIQQLRDLEEDLPLLAEGQFAFATDTKKVFIGSDDGNVDVTSGGVSDVDLTDLKSRVRSIVDIEGATFGAKINNAIASGVKYLNLEEYGDYSLASTDYIHYSNITINGNGATIRSSLPDKQLVGHNVHIKNVKFIDTATSDNNSVFMLTDAKNVSFVGCEFTTTLRHVFRLFGGEGNVITNLKIKDCKFDNITLGLTFYGEFDTIIFDGNEFSNVSDNVISGVGEGSTPEMTKKRFIFKNNIVHDCERMIVEIKRSRDIIIKDNDFRSNQYFVASLIGCRDILIENNIIEVYGIEIGPETGIDFPVTNVNISGNTFRNMTHNSIMLNTGWSGSTIRGVTISKNSFLPNSSSNKTITYAGTISNISDVNIVDNFFDGTGEIGVRGIFKGNTVVCRDTWSAVEAYDNAIIVNNIIKPAHDVESGYGSLIKLSGNDVIMDNNILDGGNKFFSCISDQGVPRLKAIVTNNKFLNAQTANVSFQDTTTFVDVQGNSYVGTTRCDGKHFLEQVSIATNIGRGLYVHRGNPNEADNPSFGRGGSICIDSANNKLYVKENDTAPHWVIK